MRIAIGGGIAVPRDVKYVQEAERLGASSVWVPELWGADALTPLAYLAATTTTIGLASGIVQIGSRTPAHARDVGDDVAVALRRTVPARHRHERPAGDGGLARRPLPSPVGATGRRSRSSAPSPAATGSSTTARSTSCRCPTDRAGRSARCSPPGRGADLRRRARSAEPRADRRAGRRLDRQRLPPRARRRLPRAAARRRRPGRARLADLDLVMPVAVEFTDDVEEAAAATPAATRSRSGRWARATKTSTTTRSRARASPTTSPPCRRCGWPAGGTRPPSRVPLELGLKTNLLGTPAMVKDRLRLYRDAGITTLQAKLDGRRPPRHAGPAHRAQRRGAPPGGLISTSFVGIRRGPPRRPTIT